MFTRIAAVVGISLLLILALDYFFLRRRFPNRPSVFWELAPVIGFIGAVLLTLAFVEAMRREVMAAWNWGIGLGLLLAIVAGVIWLMTADVRRSVQESSWRAWLRIARTYGIVLLMGVLGIVIAVRVIGALLEVFIASALGVLALGIAAVILAKNWRSRAADKE
jgi:hypothetical protein